MEHPAQNESGQSAGQISEPEEVPKNCEPGASLQSMLVATGSIEEMVEQEIDSSFTDKQVVGSTASTISEIQDGIQECQVNSEDEAEDLPVAQSVRALCSLVCFVFIISYLQAPEPIANVRDETDGQEDASTPPDEECWNSMDWRSKKKHVFILSKAGKPVYSR
jgi:hypothetical protein